MYGARGEGGFESEDREALEVDWVGEYRGVSIPHFLFFLVQDLKIARSAESSLLGAYEYADTNLWLSL